MTDPPRLLDGNSDPFERALLGSARRDHGSSTAQARCVAIATAAAVTATAGTAAGTVGAGATGKAVALGTGVAQTTVATGGVASVASSIAVKAIAVGFALGLGVQGASIIHEQHTRATSTSTEQSATLRQHHRSAEKGPRQIAAPTTDAVRESAQPTNDSEDVAVVEKREPSSEGATNRGVVTDGRASASVGSTQRMGNTLNTSLEGMSREGTSEDSTLLPARVTKDDSLDREVALLDEARHHCVAKAFDRALLLIARHDREFPLGTLGPEALVIRVQALLGQGRRDEARSLANRFIATNPSSPVSKRLRELLVQSQVAQ